MSTLLEELGQTLVPQASIDEKQQQPQQRTLLNTTMCDDSNASSVMEDIDVSNTSSSSSTSSTSSNSSNSSSCSNGSVSGCATDTDTGKGSSTVGSLDVASVSSSSNCSAASITSSVSTTAPSTTSISSGLGLVVDVDSNIGSSQELSHGYDAKSVTELDSLEDTCGSMLKDADKLCKLCR